MNNFIEELNRGAKVHTRKGLQVRILATDLSGSYPIAAAIKDNFGQEFVRQYDERGMLNGEYENSLDLVVDSNIETIYVNVCQGIKGKYIDGMVSFSEDNAKYYADNSLKECGYLYTKKVEIEL